MSQLGLILLDWREVAAVDLRVHSPWEDDARRVWVAYHQLPPYPTLAGLVPEVVELVVAPWRKPRRGYGWSLKSGRGLARGAARLLFGSWYYSSSEIRGHMSAADAREWATEKLLDVVELHNQHITEAVRLAPSMRRRLLRLAGVAA